MWSFQDKAFTFKNVEAAFELIDNRVRHILTPESGAKFGH
jgi:hypothetical protein